MKAHSQIVEEELCLRVGLLMTRQKFPERLDYFKELIKYIVRNQTSFSAEELIDLFHPRVFVADPLAMCQLQAEYKFAIPGYFVMLLVEFFYPILKADTKDVYLCPDGEKGRLMCLLNKELGN